MTGICIGFILCLLISRPLGLGALTAENMSGIATSVIVVLFLRWMFLRKYVTVRDDVLTSRAKELASKTGLDINEVRVVYNNWVGEIVFAYARYANKTVYVTKKAVLKFTPGQMDFALGHEIAHFKNMKIVVSKFQRICIALAIIAVYFTMFFSYPTSLPVLWLTGLTASAIAFQCERLVALSRRLEYEADMQAVLITGDADAAVSALEVVYAGLPKTVTEEDSGYHPTLSNRTKAIRMAGEKLRVES